ncbi:MAG TPA: AAA-like domain-containing protein [Polyangiaceae bacterium]
MARIFVSYKRNIEPDETLALELCKSLRELGHEVFIDKVMPAGTQWAKRIESELGQADWLLLLLSRDSVHSEMVRGELEIARRLAAESEHGPKILPVRVSFMLPFPYPLGGYLDGIQWAAWNRDTDTLPLVETIRLALDGSDIPLSRTHPSMAPRSEFESMVPTAAAALVDIERPEHAVSPKSRFYLRRSTDREAVAALRTDVGVTLTIRGPRQMGKTALLNHLNIVACEQKKHTAVVDFKMFNPVALKNPTDLFSQFCAWIAEELDLDPEMDPRWNRLPPAQACTKFMLSKILKPLGAPLLIAADELDRLFESPVKNEFFGMLRSWHEARAHKPAFENLDLVLVTSTDPENFLDDADGRGSPFNVGATIQLRDFSRAEVDELITLHSLDRMDEFSRNWLMALLGGHPYLTRRALYLIATDQWKVSRNPNTDELIGPASPFSDHLRHYLLQLQSRSRLAVELKRALSGQACSSPLLFSYLHGAGLLSGSHTDPSPRCVLYEHFFRSVL